MTSNQNENGYIVFQEGGRSPIAYGARSDWFQTYDAAIDYAMEIVRHETDSVRKGYSSSLTSVVVYNAPEGTPCNIKMLPGGSVVFKWSDFNREW